MVPEKIYEIGNMLGLTKKEIDGIKKGNNEKESTISSPADSYNNAIGRYGTVSINDF